MIIPSTQQLIVMLGNFRIIVAFQINGRQHVAYDY